MESCTPVPELTLPRDLHTASISSKMMMCRSLSSPFALYSASASANKARMFSSLCPTYLLITSGPLTILGSCPLSIFPICRAMSVFPVPGGPWSSMPLTWWIPSRCTTDCGKTRVEKARLKMSSNCLSAGRCRVFSRAEILVLNSAALIVLFWFVILIAEPCAASNTNDVSGTRHPRWLVTPSPAPETSNELIVTR